ncbi:3-hydroxyacyl-CoA dehydrogenase family protein [Longibaculum muris]|uniref:3-hydroxyacyl-CoA dehydrogenase family protein n=1 Tax=Longibaculum muris TaxID=1796628 RepID=UPI0022E68843|nr:3-hydroxyacyl-CoA dehydrogenase family protein [Longibaculum muris]
MNIKTVTVLGANGTMGRNVSAIFASFGQAKVYMMCRNMKKSEEAVKLAFHSIRAESIKDNLIPVTYDDLQKCISESDLIFESLSEDLSVKKEMYQNLKKYLKKEAIIATGTSGLSIKKLSQSFGVKSNDFFGIHMFNPPYNLPLCELIVHDDSQRLKADRIKEYLSNKLKRTVVEVKDSPSFLGNRIGFFFINQAMIMAERYKDQGGIDYIDSILGNFTGRNMSPLVTSDFVGLDVHKSIVDYIYENTEDSFNEYFKAPEYLNRLVDEGMLGRKVNNGLYHKDRDRNDIYVYDIKSNEYRIKNNYQFYFANKMIKNILIGDYNRAIDILLSDESLEAIICKTMLLQYIVYSLKISMEVSTDIRSCDDAMATGFSWIPPIALISLLGGKKRVRELSKKYLDDNFNDILEDRLLFDSIPEYSNYDFRPFLKARY